MKKLLLLSALFMVLKSGYAQPGSIDLSFGKKGTVRTDLGTSVNYASTTRQVLPQSDGSVFVVFESAGQTLIAKKLLSGSPDSSYGTAGISVSVSILSAHAAIQKDGKIVVAGTVPAAEYGNPEDRYDRNYDFALSRFNTDGSIDITFNKGEKVTTEFFGDYDAVNSIAIGQDGKIVVAGFTAFYQVNPDNPDDYKIHSYNISLARYNIDGSRDNTLGTDGRYTTPLKINADMFNSVAVQTDGKIVLAGNDTNGLSVGRFNANGSIDSTFSFSNNIKNSSGSYLKSRSVAIQGDGRIVLGGYWQNSAGNNDFVLARLNTTGSLDKTFDTDGIQATDFRTYNDVINSLAIQSDGKIVAGGYASNGSNDAFALARYNTNGSPDNTFDADGKKMNYIGSYNVYAVSIIIQNGKIVAGGYNSTGTATNIALARYNITDGTLDNTFNGNGTAIDYFKQKNTVFTSSAVQKDGKIVAAGYAWNGTNYDFAVARYNTNGSLDNSFSTDGIQMTDMGSSDNKVSGVAIQQDGKIVVTGTVSNGATTDFGIVRYNTNGSLDLTFSNDGKVTTDFGYSEKANAIAIQSNGKIVVTGSSNGKFALARYNADGSLDNTFDGDGKQVSAFGTEANAIAIQSDGKIVVAGYVYYNDGFLAIARYNSNGSIDSTFSQDGIQTAAVSNFFGNSSEDIGSNIQATSLSIQRDGKIIVGASGGYYERNTRDFNLCIARLNSNGSFDATFAGDGTQVVPFKSNSDYASIALQDNGKILAQGNLYANNTGSEVQLGYGIARLNTDGTSDAAFGSNGVIYSQQDQLVNIRDLVIFDNKLYAAGYGADVSNFGFLARYLLTANKAPTVSITSPANNTVYAAPATITINAAASDSDGTIYSVKFYNGSTYLKTDFTSPYSYTLSNLPAGTYSITAKATDNAGAETISAPVKVKVNKAPVVSITSPTNNATFTAPATITVNASASDADGSIYSVKFYNGTTYIKTDFTSPYTYTFSNLPAGNYTFTVKATDNIGAQTISAAVTVSVKAPNKAPTVSITSPADNANYLAPANITVNALAADADGSIYSVKFYNGSTYLKTVFASPYTYTLSNLPAGTYTLTTKATDNLGAQTISAPVRVTVSNASAKPFFVDSKTSLSDMRLYPNPTTNMVNVYTTGLAHDKQATISVISLSGIVMKTMQTNSSAKTVQLDVSSLAKGVYTIKMISGDKVMYKQFVKL
jgi:uncharacterized delta-60 repeat protein